MPTWFQQVFDPSGLTPHGFCMAWDPPLLWLHVVSNSLTALAYYSIPLALIRLVRARTDLVFPYLFWLFAVFIMACGTTHLLDVVSIWVPIYWASGLVMALTAAVSVLAAVELWPVLPRILALPSAASLRAANQALERQIGESRALAARLAESEARFRAFFEHVPDLKAVLRAQPDGAWVIEIANHTLLRWFGLAPASAVGLRLDDPRLRDAGPMLAEQCRQCLANPRLRRFDHALRDAAGVRHWFEVLLVPVAARPEPDPALGSGAVMLSLRDVTERYRMHQRLAESHRMEAMGQLTAGLAHDFNNLMMGVSGALQLVPRMRHDDPNRARIVAAAQQSIERGDRLVRQLLGFARKQPMQTVAVDVAQVVGAMANDLLAHALGGRVQVRTALAPGLPPVLADQAQLESALLNLAINGRDAMPEGGLLTITADRVTLDAEGQASPPLGSDGSPPDLPAGVYVVLDIADQGSGMPPEVVARAFDPFFTTKPVGEGTGLGLSQVYGFARQSGGTASIASRPGAGTTVSLWLPAAPPAGPEAMPTAT
jgi:PAS domain S-box-containing protein